ncbi:hypothetical protein ACH42_17170 [Endozoicomonas sp. (ex Bugula neritina AB1)]|nr:hypothetical protein ACH42_17170 [Endozoicomonas sp. (ex Bugula neritina AB1)]
MNELVFAFMEAFDDDDAPDGAWWAMLEEGVRAYNELNNTRYDEHNTVHAYLKYQSTLPPADPKEQELIDSIIKEIDEQIGASNA